MINRSYWKDGLRGVRYIRFNDDLYLCIREEIDGWHLIEGTFILNPMPLGTTDQNNAEARAIKELSHKLRWLTTVVEAHEYNPNY